MENPDILEENEKLRFRKDIGMEDAKKSLLKRLSIVEEVIGTSYVKMAFKNLESQNGYKKPDLMVVYEETGAIETNDITPDNIQEFLYYITELDNNLSFYRKIMSVREAFTLIGVAAVGGGLGLVTGAVVKRLRG